MAFYGATAGTLIGEKLIVLNTARYSFINHGDCSFAGQLSTG